VQAPRCRAPRQAHGGAARRPWTRHRAHSCCQPSAYPTTQTQRSAAPGGGAQRPRRPRDPRTRAPMQYLRACAAAHDRLCESLPPAHRACACAQGPWAGRQRCGRARSSSHETSRAAQNGRFCRWRHRPCSRSDDEHAGPRCRGAGLRAPWRARAAPAGGLYVTLLTHSPAPH